MRWLTYLSQSVCIRVGETFKFLEAPKFVTLIIIYMYTHIFLEEKYQIGDKIF